jgi:hypothetical protein
LPLGLFDARIQYLNSQRALRLKTPVLIVNHRKPDLRYELADAFLLFLPAPRAAAQDRLKDFTSDAIARDADDALSRGTDFVEAAVRGVIGAAVKLLTPAGAAVLSALFKIIDALETNEDGNPPFVVVLDHRAQDGQELARDRQVIPIRSAIDHSPYETPLGTAPELWIYGFGDFQLRRSKARPREAGDVLVNRMMTADFDFAPTGRLLVRRARAAAADPQDG